MVHRTRTARPERFAPRLKVTMPRLRHILFLLIVLVVLAPAYNEYGSKAGLPGLSELPAWVEAKVAAPVPDVSGPVDVARARAQLETLTVRPAASMGGYSRDAFRHWSDPDDNGCDARQDTLRRDGDRIAPRRGCTVTGGVWTDPYGGSIVRVPGSLDIDHMVPLANAWRSGAARWNDAQREKFANDPKNLLAVSASLNRQKGDKGPEAWKPPRAGYRRAYAAHWIRVKAGYRLSITAAEKSALRQMLS